MTNQTNPSRNDPCPCGSGKKFKKCHGSNTPVVVPEEDHFGISREIAYKGVIGLARREFCEQFIARKEEAYKKISERQADIAAIKSETITCRKGCCNCCSLLVDSSLQEAEAIVYYLYQNEIVLQTFLKQYPAWRQQVRAAGDSFQKIHHNWEKIDGKWHDKKSVDGGIAALYEFTVANIPCPFLQNSTCSIYPVRPYVCAGAFATTPAELCLPPNRSRAKIYTSLEPDIVDDISFYYQSLAQPVQSFMPITVYQLLNDGLIGLPEIPGIENLPRGYLNDPEVKADLERYLKQANRS